MYVYWYVGVVAFCDKEARTGYRHLFFYKVLKKYFEEKIASLINDATNLRRMKIPPLPQTSWTCSRTFETYLDSDNLYKEMQQLCREHIHNNQDFSSGALAELSAITASQIHDLVFLEVAPSGPSVVPRIVMR